MEQQLQTVAAAREQYSTATQQAHELAHASLLANFPFLNSVSAQQLPAVLDVLQRENPTKHAAVVLALHSADRLYRLALFCEGFCTSSSGMEQLIIQSPGFIEVG